MQPEKLTGKVGAPVIGPKEFFDRERELASILEAVQRGDSIYISAPRRIGKTSLMHRAIEELEKAGHTCLFFDLEGYGAPSEWIAEWFIATVGGKKISLTGRVSAAIRAICTEMGASEASPEGVLRGLFNASNWRKNGDSIFKVFVDSCAAGKKCVVFLDELAVMIERLSDRKKEVDEFLSWLRDIQQTYLERLSFVAASSIGLPPLLNRLGLSSRMNAFKIIPVDAWEPDTAVRCIHALARGAELEIPDEAAHCMTELIGWCSPSYVQLFVDALKDTCRSRSCTCEDVQRVYQKEIIRGHRGVYILNHMEERLRNIFNEKEYVQVMRLLAVLSTSDKPMTGNELAEYFGGSEDSPGGSFQNVLLNLEYDGYVEKGEQGWYFRSPLLKDWWKHRYGEI